MEEKKERCNFWYAKKSIDIAIKDMVARSNEGNLNSEEGIKEFQRMVTLCCGFLRQFNKDCGCKQCFEYAAYLIEMMVSSFNKAEFSVGNETIGFGFQNQIKKGE